MAGREQTFTLDLEVCAVQTITHVSICFFFPPFLLGVQLVCQCQEAIEEHGEAAGPELGAQDQALQQVCPGQRREAERQQRGQLLRRYGLTAPPSSIPP